MAYYQFLLREALLDERVTSPEIRILLEDVKQAIDDVETKLWTADLRQSSVVAL